MGATLDQRRELCSVGRRGKGEGSRGREREWGGKGRVRGGVGGRGDGEGLGSLLSAIYKSTVLLHVHGVVYLGEKGELLPTALSTCLSLVHSMQTLSSGTQ